MNDTLIRPLNEHLILLEDQNFYIENHKQQLFEILQNLRIFQTEFNQSYNFDITNLIFMAQKGFLEKY